jgi:hypothetical protein
MPKRNKVKRGSKIAGEIDLIISSDSDSYSYSKKLLEETDSKKAGTLRGKGSPSSDEESKAEEPAIGYGTASAKAEISKVDENSPGSSTIISNTTTLKNGKFTKYVCVDSAQFKTTNAVDGMFPLLRCWWALLVNIRFMYSCYYADIKYLSEVKRGRATLLKPTLDLEMGKLGTRRRLCISRPIQI